MIDPKLLNELLTDPNIKYADVMLVCYAKPPKGITILAGVDMKHWSEEARQIWLKEPGELKAVDGAELALISETLPDGLMCYQAGSSSKLREE